MDIQAKKIAQNYAKAFLNCAGHSFTSFHCQTLQAALGEVHKYSDFSMALKIPMISSDVKKEGLLRWFRSLDLPGPIEKLVNLLIQHQRLFLFPLIMQEVCDEYNERNNIVACSIRATLPLTTEQIGVIHQFLEYKTGKSIQARVIEDKELIAGIRMQSDFFLWEYSLRQRLRNIAKLV